jgi:hypothetical protein
MVSCEPLLMIFVTLSFYCIIRGVDNNAYWVPAGFFTGCAYMTKASGLFIVFGFGLFLLFDVRMKFWKLLKNKYLWLYLLMFLVVSMPLLVRNTIVYKFPFYNYNVDMLAMEENWGQVTRKVTFFDLYKKDSLYLTKRFFFGLVKEFRILLHSLYSFSIHTVPKFSGDDSTLFVKLCGALVSITVFILALAGIIKSSMQKRKKILVLFLMTGFYLPLSWYSITSPNRRYILPLLPFFVFFSSLYLISLINRVMDKFYPELAQNIEKKSKALLYLLLLCSLFTIITYPVSHDIPAPRDTFRFEDGYHEIAAYLRKNLNENKKYLTKGFHHYEWTLFYPDLNAKIVSMRFFHTMSEFNEFLKQNNTVSFMLMQPEMYRATKNIFTEFIAFDNNSGLIVKKPIPGWEIAMKDRTVPVNYILYRKSGK